MGKPAMCGSASVRLSDLGLQSGQPLHVNVPLKDQGTLSVEIEFVDTRPLFGLDLTSVVERECGTVPNIIRCCTTEVEKNGLEEAGLYRVPGRTTDVERLKDLFEDNDDAGIPVDNGDVNAVASLLKVCCSQLGTVCVCV
jgi:hypothetical protein